MNLPYIFIKALLLFLLTTFFCQAEQKVTITLFTIDKSTDETLESSHVFLKKHGEKLDSAYTDENGMVEFSFFISNIESYQSESSSYFIDNVYPNPFEDKTNININVPESQKLNASIFNLMGNLVYSDDFLLSAGSHTLEVFMPGVETGVYFLKVEGYQSQTVKLLKSGDIKGGSIDISPASFVENKTKPTPTKTIDNKPKAGGEKHSKEKQKTDGETYTFKAYKDNYAVKEVNAEIVGDTTINMKMQRSYESKFIVKDINEDPVNFNLLLIGDFDNKVITTPATVDLPSGYYSVLGANSEDTTDVMGFIEVKQTDSVYVFQSKSFDIPDINKVTSHDLIDEALEKGEIDEETALIYKVFAAFEKDRLPSEYVGEGGKYKDTHIMTTVMDKYWNEKLSPEAEEILEPYMVMPIYKGSWWDRKHSGNNKDEYPPCTPRDECDKSDDWTYHDFDKVRVWWVESTDARKNTAKNYANIIENHIWEKLTDFMGREPLCDGDVGEGWFDRTNNGGSDHLDLILVDMERGGKAVPYDGGSNSPAYLMINTGLNHRVNIYGLLAHEFMHAIQFAYDIEGSLAGGKHEWWAESNAVWAEIYTWEGYIHEEGDTPVEMQRFRSHHFAHYFFKHFPNNSMTTSSFYGSYIWPQFIEKKLCDKGGGIGLNKIKGIWEYLEDKDIGCSALAWDKYLSEEGYGGLEEQFPRFARYLWNREPYNQITEWRNPNDTIILKVTPENEGNEDISLGGEKDHRIKMLEDSVVNPLSAKYYHFNIDDDNIRTFLFANGFNYSLDIDYFGDEFGPHSFGEVRMLSDIDEENNAGRSVQMLIRLEDEGWVPAGEDDVEIFEGPGNIAFLDENSSIQNKIEEVVFIFTNSNIDEKAQAPNLPPEIEVSNYACGAWEGHLEMTANDGDIEENWIVTDIEWEDMSSGLPDPDKYYDKNKELDEYPLWVGLYYTLNSATVNWSISGEKEFPEENKICTYSGNKTFEVTDNTMMFNTFQTIHHTMPVANSYRGFLHQGYINFPPNELTITINCETEDGEETTYSSGPKFIDPSFEYGYWVTNGNEFEVSDCGTEISGNTITGEDPPVERSLLLQSPVSKDAKKEIKKVEQKEKE